MVAMVGGAGLGGEGGGEGWLGGGGGDAWGKSHGKNNTISGWQTEATCESLTLTGAQWPWETNNTPPP